MKHAVICEKTRQVKNVILWDEQSIWPIPKGHYLIKSEVAAIEDFHDANKGSFTRPSIIGMDPVLKDK